jgi:uncharacterized protein YdhG (YjbR/CyaY superfamily)
MRLNSVAVGTGLAAGPPHRSVRAELPHTALTSGVWRRTDGTPGRSACWVATWGFRRCGERRPKTRNRRTKREPQSDHQHPAPTIRYMMPAFRQHGILVYFAAWEKPIGMYPPISGNMPLEKAIARYAGPNGNLQFLLEEPIPNNLIEQDSEKAAAKRKTIRAARRMFPRTTSSTSQVPQADRVPCPTPHGSPSPCACPGTIRLDATP